MCDPILLPRRKKNDSFSSYSVVTFLMKVFVSANLFL